MKKLFTILILTIVLLLGGKTSTAQTTLQTVDFETAGSGYTITGEAASSWVRTDGTGISPDVAFTVKQGTYYFYAENTDGASGNSQIPVYVTLSSVNVSGYNNFQVKLLVAGKNGIGSGYEGGEYLKIQYSLDGGAFTTAAQFIPSRVDVAYLTSDANADGTTDGSNLSPAFTEFTYNLTGTGTTLQIRIMANIDQGSEEVGFDNIRLQGTLAPTATPPTVTTTAATSVSSTGATLNGSINANSASTTVTFEYGLTTGYGSTVPADQSPVTGSTATSVTKAITGLTASTIYHYRVKGVNAGGTTYGGDLSFTTSAGPTATAPSGSGTIGDPYQIATLNNLYWVSDQVNNNSNTFSGKYLIQTADIDATSTSTWFSGQGWMPIGYASDNGFATVYTFSGNYDGQNHIVSNLTINRTVICGYGLFGSVDYSTIKNLGVTNVTITATGANDMYAGGLIGYVNAGCIIENCYSTGTVTCKWSPGGLIGTIVDETNPNTVSGCHSECNVTATHWVAGGLVAESYKGSTITNCYSTGSVTGLGACSYIGGLIGNNVSDISQCYSSSAVTGGTGNSIGGLLGDDYGNISNCYATGSVTSSGIGVGGLIGNHNAYYGGIISNCYAKGAVSGSTGVGGLIGTNTGTPSNNVTNSFWDTQTSLQSSSAGGTGKTTIAMKTVATFTGAGWSTSVWALFADGVYPKFLWELPTVTTTAITIYNASSATMGGNVTVGGTTSVTERGVVYSTTDATPTIGESGVTKVAIGSGTGSFSQSVGSLTAGTLYYVNAYSTNTAGTSYGTATSFTTMAGAVAPTATTNAATSITSTGATLNGSINANGSSTTVTFEYGLTTGYGTTVTAGQSPVTGSSATSASKAITGLTASTTYHYRVVGVNSGGTTNGSDLTFATNSAIIWTGTTNSDWNTTGNWDSGIVPISSSNVSIPNVTNDPIVNEASPPAVCNNLSIASGAVLTIAAGKALTVNGTLTNNAGIIGLVVQSTSSASDGTGVLLNGTAGVQGTVERYVSGNLWHLISPAATAGESVINFVGASQNANLIARNATNYALAPWLEGTGKWDYYKVSGSNTSGQFGTPAKGFQVLRATNAGTGTGSGSDGGKLTFKGTLAAANLNIPVSKSLYGWNLIGNPYPCALDVAAFIATNTALLDPNFQFIYVSKIADLTTYGYDPNTAGLKLASGEGFFVKTIAGGGNISFTTAMKSNVADAFKAATVDNPTIRLTVEDGNAKLGTTVEYLGGATKGLDPGKDAGLFNGIASSLSLFTRLIEDNGVDFTVQALPDNNLETMVVPVGLVADNGATVTFKAMATNLPAGYKVVLEDKETNTFTRLDKANSSYTVSLNTATLGTGRFYLHTTEIVSAIDESLLSGVKVVPIPEQNLVRIIGNFDLPAKAMVYDMNGKLVATSVVTSQIENDIPLTNCATGVYLLKVESGSATETAKFIWKRK